MKRIIICSLLVISLFSGCSKSNSASSQNIILAPSSGTLGIVFNDKIKFYNASYNGWIEETAVEFVLPSGYKNVLAPSSGTLGVVFNDKIKFYNASYNGWIEETAVEFDLKT
jgi:hypothetical protein